MNSDLSALNPERAMDNSVKLLAFSLLLLFAARVNLATGCICQPVINFSPPSTCCGCVSDGDNTRKLGRFLLELF